MLSYRAQTPQASEIHLPLSLEFWDYRYVSHQVFPIINRERAVTKTVSKNRAGTYDMAKMLKTTQKYWGE